MPVKTDVHVPPPANSHQPGVTRSLLYNGSRFQGYQKSKGNCYDVEVVLQVTKTCVRVFSLITVIYVSTARGRRKFLLVRLLKDQGFNRGVSHTHDILRRGNYQQEISVFNQKMGRR